MSSNKFFSLYMLIAAIGLPELDLAIKTYPISAIIFMIFSIMCAFIVVFKDKD